MNSEEINLKNLQYGKFLEQSHETRTPNLPNKLHTIQWFY